MSFLSFGIGLSMRPSLGTLRNFVFTYAAHAPISTTPIFHQKSDIQNTHVRTAQADYYRLRYQNDPEFRRAQILRCRIRLSTPRGQETTRKSNLRRRPVDGPRLRLSYQESSDYRRTRGLMRHIRYHFGLGELDKDWSWRTHTPLVYPIRVDHHCTACDRDRYLKIWWKQKSETSTTDEPRYMCTSCFASDPERMMPERHPPKLPGFFTDIVDKRSSP